MRIKRIWSHRELIVIDKEQYDKLFELVDLVNKHSKERMRTDKLSAWKLAKELKGTKIE